MSQKDNIELENELHSQQVMGNSSSAELYLLRNLILAIRRNFILILFFACLVGAVAYGATFLVTEKFASTARVKLDTRVAVDPEYTPVVSGLPTTLTSIESEIEVLRSSDLIERVLIEFGMYRPNADPESDDQVTDQTAYLEEMIEKIRDSRTIEQVGNSAVFEIKVVLANKYLAAKIANALAREYLNTQTAQKIEALERAQGWLETRTEQLQAKMSKLVVDLETHLLKSPFTIDEYATLKAQRQIAERQLRMKKEKLTSLSALTTEIRGLLSKAMLVEAAQLVPNPDAQLQAALMLAGDETTPETEETLTSEISKALTEISEQLKSTSDTIQDIVSKIDKLNESQELQAVHNGETRQIENEITVTAAIYQDFVSQLSRRTEQNEYLDSDGRIIEIARPATAASEPRRNVLSALAFVLAGILGTGIVLVREINHGRLRTVQEIEETTGLPLRSILPDIGKDVDVIAAILDETQEIDPNLVHFSRKLRVSLDKPGKVQAEKENTPSIPNTKIIAGTASEENEGLSSSLLLLAAAFAESGQKTLLLDCNFWHSAYTDFGSDTQMKYRGNTDRPELIYKLITITQDPMLHILPAFAFHTANNKNDLAAVFGSPDFNKFLNFLAEKYDVIIIDTPPLLPVIDATMILSLANQVVFFTRWNKTPIGSVKQAIRILEDVNIEPVFCVATRVKLNKIAKYGDSSLKYLNMAIEQGY